MVLPTKGRIAHGRTDGETDDTKHDALCLLLYRWRHKDIEIRVYIGTKNDCRPIACLSVRLSVTIISYAVVCLAVCLSVFLFVCFFFTSISCFHHVFCVSL